MNNPKPAITQATIRAVLENHFAEAVEDLTTIRPGHFAQVYGFRVGSIEYVIRAVTSTKATSFTKEQFIFTQLLSKQVPIPIPIPQHVHIGQTDTFHFAISYRIPGVPLDTLSQADYDQVLPELIRLLDAIHQTDVSDYAGYGSFADNGFAACSSWHTYLAEIKNEESEELFYGKWHRLFDETYLDRGLFYRLYQQMADHLPFCSEERYLLHGDYGFDNVLVKGGAVSGILDWSQAKYGDPLYEVARLDFWSPDTGYRSRFHEYYQAQDGGVSAFAERIRCYQCHNAMDALRFFAKNGDKQAYDWIVKRIAELHL